MLAGLIAVAACGPAPTPSATVPPGASPPATAGATAGTPGTAGPSPATTATSSPSAFDPRAVTVRVEELARIDGQPLAFAALPGRPAAMYVASQDGRVWLLDGGTVAAGPVVDLRDRIASGGERGLLGIAVHPGFPADRRVFVDYTDQAGDTVVSSLEAGADGATIDPGSERILLQVDQPYANHNGGGVAFGPDGYLYISLGDGGSGGDPHGNGQALEVLLGKILRIDVDGEAPYAVPADNPFRDGGGEPEIWHFGLRNPWRISFDRETGDLWIGDVGQGDWEEVDVARAGLGGLNFGWNVMEGTHCFSASSCDQAGLTLPVSEYDHTAGCTVIGGYVYRGEAFAMLRGGYLFTDYCSGWIWAIDAASDAFQRPIEVGRGGRGLAAFGEDGAGELYLASLDGTISRIVAVGR